MTWIFYPDDHEAPKIRSYLDILSEVGRELLPNGGSFSKEHVEIIEACNKRNIKPLHDWLLERNRCFVCHGHGEDDWWGEECPACLGDGTRTTQERLEKLKAFE